MAIPSWFRASSLLLVVAFLISRSVGSFAAAGDYDIAQNPLYSSVTYPPLMMLVMSRDEQLFNKAYSDYSNLQEGDKDDDGVIDATYDNAFNYSGYFDPGLCYSYGSSMFKASGAATNHKCSAQWSGNFLNWVTMSRLDIMRYVLYGGMRSTDSTTQTVLERAPIPNDLHAWVKVYHDDGSFTPHSGLYSFCNATVNSEGTLPLMRVASGGYTEWAATSGSQCLTSNGSDTPSKATNYTVRVDVCDNADARESFCKKYSDGANTYWKPTGLLQEYGESGKLRFGLISGSYSNPRAGGVLRRNIGLFTGNGTDSTCASNATTGGIDEIDTSTGQFCWKISGKPAATGEGIIRTLDNFKLTQWSGSVWSDCNTYGILNQDMRDKTTGNRSCIGWGNPLAEMYGEALRYISGDYTSGSTSAATSAFVSNATNDLSGLPAGVAWNDPYRSADKGGNSYCATCSILVLSSGLPSFDSDNLASTVSGYDGAVTATTNLGTKEGLSGNYFVGRTTGVVDNSNYADYCSSHALQGLGKVLGICPDSPATEGSYLIAGLAQEARAKDIRSARPPANRPSGTKNTVTTYAVQMAENLPSFRIPVGDGAITLSPLCQANNNGSAKPADGGWRTCFLGSVGIGATTATVSPNYVYGRDLVYSDGRLVAGSYKLVWEDSMWGNDHDNDLVTMLSFCVGAFCNVKGKNEYDANQNICWRSNSAVCDRNPTGNEVLVRVEILSQYAGNALLNGFTVTGSDGDGTKRDLLGQGNTFTSILSAQAENSNKWGSPIVYRFAASSGSAGVLENPLWYAAKYGGTDKNGDWDTDKDGIPDAYFLAHNPSKLQDRLAQIFQKASASNAVTGGAAGGARISANSLTIETTYSLKDGTNNDWTGDVIGMSVNNDGTAGGQLWSASAKMPSAGGRKVYFVRAPTVNDASTGAVDTAVDALSLSATNLAGTTRGDKLATLGLPKPGTPAWFDGSRSVQDFVDYIKGAATYEMQNGGTLRNRSSALGDIINATPELVSPLDDYGYGYWSSFSSVAWKEALGNSYKTYLAGKSERTPMAYVGANDGMLHAFTANNDSTGGVESFAFIPAASRMHLADLPNPDYSHHYFVDGGTVSADVSFDSSGDWHSVLVGSVGAGGKSVYALDVSNPDSFDGTNVLWELDGTSLNDLGYVLGKPVVVPIRKADGSPRWVAMFGNGVNSASGAPVLFVVDIATGELLAKLKPSGTGYAVKNGLMNIAPVALNNSDGLVDTVYGGDMQGNLWKFDLADADPADWNVAFSGEPLFVATSEDGSSQPITGGLEVSTGPGGGVSIFFGTGQYFTTTDNNVSANPVVQSLYGIWDPNTATSGPVTDRGELVGQTITGGVTANGYETRNVSKNQVSYASKRGWYVDLVVSGGDADGERFIGSPRLQNGRVIFTTFEPNGGSECDPNGGTNWLYALNLLNGAGNMSGITTSASGSSVCTGDCGGIALNKDGKSSPPVRETGIFVPPQGEVTCDATDPTCVQKKLDAEKCTFVLRAPGADPLYLPRPCGRQSWRQVR